MNRRAGKRTTSAQNNGLNSSVAVSVPVNSQGSFCTPDATATSSRMGRKMK